MSTYLLDGVSLPATPEIIAAAAVVITPFVPTPITRRQLILALLAVGRISAADAEAAAAGGAVPAPFAAVLETLPAADAVSARITWAAMAVAERPSPLIALLIAAGLGTAAEWDEIFRVGATL